MIDTPSTVPVKAEILAAEEAVRNNVTLLEAESQRLERLISSQKRELISLDGALVDVKDQLDLITSMRISVAKEVVVIEDKKESLTAEVKTLTNIIETTKAEIARREDELSGRESDITSAEEMLQEAELSFRERSVLLEKNIEEVEEKKQILIETLSKI